LASPAPYKRREPGKLQAAGQGLAQGLPPLLLSALRLVDSVVSGSHGRRRAGIGESFWQFRPYVAGDSIQSVDWRATAKSDRVMLREREWETAASLYLWRDSSASMAWRGNPKQPEKRERADLLLLAAAAAALRAGERIGYIGPEGKPMSGIGTLHRLVAMLEAAQGENLPPMVPLQRHAAVLLIGDFLDPLEEIDARLRRLLARGQPGVLVQIVDPAEAALPFQGRTRFEGLENEGQWLAPRAEAIRAAYVERFTHHCGGLASLARQRGLGFVQHVTDGPASPALIAIQALLQPIRSGSVAR